MRQFSFFLNVQANTWLYQKKAYSSLISNSNSWHSVAKSVPKTYASQAQKLARSLEEKFNIAEDGTVINAKNGVKSTVRAEDLMSFYVTKKKTKLTPANLTDILEEMKALQVSPLNAHSKKVYEEAKNVTEKSSPAEPERVKTSAITSTSASQQQTREMVESLQPSVTVLESLDEVVKEREKPKRLHFEEVTANDLTDLHLQTAAFSSVSKSKEFATLPHTKEEVEVENVPTKLESSKVELAKTPEKALDAESSQAKVEVEETEDKVESVSTKLENSKEELAKTPEKSVDAEAKVEVEEKSDKISAKSEKIIKTEIIQSQVDPISNKVKPPEKSKDPVSVDLLEPKPVMPTNSKPVDVVSQPENIDSSGQSSSDSPPSPAATLSNKSQTESTDVLMYLLVGLCITLGIYLFKTRDKNETSAKEMIPLPPQDEEKDNSDDLKTDQTFPEVKDDVQDPEIVHSTDSSLGQTETSVELQSLKVN